MEVPRMKSGDRTRGQSIPPREPSLADPEWREFTLEWERLTDAVDGDWTALRRGFRRLKSKAKARKAMPYGVVEQHLAYSAFELAARWELSPRIVRATFNTVWSGGYADHLRISAAALFFSWASRLSPVDVAKAQTAVVEARRMALGVTEPVKRANLERMLQVLTEPGSRSVQR